LTRFSGSFRGDDGNAWLHLAGLQEVDNDSLDVFYRHAVPEATPMATAATNMLKVFIFIDLTPDASVLYSIS
jgi:hypothetical protein